MDHTLSILQIHGTGSRVTSRYSLEYNFQFNLYARNCGHDIVGGFVQELNKNNTQIFGCQNC